MDEWIAPLLAALALPRYGLSTVFVIAFVSATLLPMGSEPAVFGLVKLNPDLCWPAVLVATAGNTLGGAGKNHDRIGLLPIHCGKIFKIVGPDMEVKRGDRNSPKRNAQTF